MDATSFSPRLLIFDKEAQQERVAAQGQLRHRFNEISVLSQPEHAAEQAALMNNESDFAILIVSDLCVVRNNGFTVLRGNRHEMEMIGRISVTGLGICIIEEWQLRDRFYHFFGVFDADEHRSVPTRLSDLWRYSHGKANLHSKNIYFSRHWRHIHNEVRRLASS